jgi:hypothetical protein
MGRACSKHGRSEKCIETLIGRRERKKHLEDVEVDGRVILKRMLNETGCRNVDRIHVTEDRAQWWAVSNTVKNLRVA